MSERWLTFEDAVGVIKASSVGKSQAMLKSACASGEVRTQEPIFLNDDGVVGMRRTQIGVRRFSEDDLLDWLARQPPEKKPTSPSMPSPHRAGRPPAYDWGAIRKVTCELMDENGDFSVDDPEWNAQARLEEILSEKFGMAISTLREQLPKLLTDWRKLKVGN